jgi:pimeloyl-ACP methyl ester carboxylesterase
MEVEHERLSHRRNAMSTLSKEVQAEQVETIVEFEKRQVERANSLNKQPVVFVHGLWLLPSSWNRWSEMFEAAGYDPPTVQEANANPEVMARKTVGQIADHFEEIIRELKIKPAVIGHSFGGLLAQILAGRGLSAVTVAIDPAPFRGVLPLPIAALRSSWPVLHNPANRDRAVPLTFDQFHYAFANMVSEEEAQELYKNFAVPGSGVTLFQAATANLNPWTEAKVDVSNPERGPMLIISGDKDHTVPPAMAHAAYDQQKKNRAVTEFLEIKGRGHSLTIDSRWREVADKAIEFVRGVVG